MDPNVIAALIGVGATLLISLVGGIAYVIQLRIKPLESKVNENKQERIREINNLKHDVEKKLDQLSTDTKDLKDAIIKEIKAIAAQNTEFRLQYVQQINELKLSMSQGYVTTDVLQRELSILNDKNKAEMEMILKEIQNVKESQNSNKK